MATGASPAPPPDGALPPRRQVVTAWVQRADGRVAVVQRSGEVNSYQYKWGGISGGVEGDEPLLLRCLLEVPPPSMFSFILKYRLPHLTFVWLLLCVHMCMCVVGCVRGGVSV